jgi:CRISPR-associated protein (TIGR02710 family)
MPAPILVCTVGGSPEPVLSAIRHTGAGRVVFLCSAEGGRDGRGSQTMLDGPDGIPARAGLAEGAWEQRIIAADDPDRAFVECHAVLTELRRRHPRAELRCDYTGGTKSMSAALILARIAAPGEGVKLQVMTGERQDLKQVTDGTEQPLTLAVDTALAERALARAAALWSSHGYAEAAAVLQPFVIDLEHAESVPRPFRERLAQVYRVSEMLAAWDRFEHARALHLLKTHRLGRGWSEVERLRAPLDLLADPARRMPLLLLDLCHNALRRAARGQFDDAVARCYRLVEATAQHLLKACDVDTAAVDLARLPETLREKWGRKLGPKREAGLLNAWHLLHDLDPERAATRHLWQECQGRKPIDRLQSWIEHRNFSLLAHGFEPVGEKGWDEVRSWLDRYWIGAIWPSLAADLDLPQLPDRLPEPQ